MDACSQCAVRKSAICRTLVPEKLGEFSKLGRRRRLRRGQALMWEGDESLIVGNVIEGMLKLSISSADGREQTLALAYPGDFVGRAFGLTSEQTLMAVSDVQLCTFKRSSFDDFARRNIEIEHELLKRTLSELDRSRKSLLLLGRMSAGQRVAAFLLETAERLHDPQRRKGESNGTAFTLPFGRQDIANLLGLTIETVSRQITKLRREGVIDTPDRRSVVILDQDALEEAAGAA